MSAQCLLYPQKRTFGDAKQMSALGQKRTFYTLASGCLVVAMQHSLALVPLDRSVRMDFPASRTFQSGCSSVLQSVRPVYQPPLLQQQNRGSGAEIQASRWCHK